jgi:hypothetical protein
MLAEIIDPTVEPVPADWEIFRKQENLLAAWQAEALTAFAWCAARPVRLGVVRDGGQVVALFVGDLTVPLRRPGRYATPGSLSGTGWFDCRLLLGFTSGFAFAARLGSQDRIAALAAFEKALRRRLGRHCLGILYRQVSPELLPEVGRRLRPRRATAPNTLLVNRWSELGEYFAELPRSQRRRLQRVHAEAAERTQVLAGANEIDPEQASILGHVTRLKHGDRFPPVPTRYFRSLNGSDGVRYFGHRDDERLLAFDLAFDDGNRLVTTITGALEVRNGGRRDLYFDLYLLEIDYMITEGRAGCEFGKGMTELKQRFGCELIPQFVVVAAW